MKRGSRRKKVNLLVVALPFVAVALDYVIAYFFGATFRSWAYIFGSTFKENFLALMFIEGAFFLGVGALFVGGFVENRMTNTSGPKSAYDIEMLSKDRAEMRKQQAFLGIRLMVVGGILIFVVIIGSVV